MWTRASLVKLCGWILFQSTQSTASSGAVARHGSWQQSATLVRAVAHDSTIERTYTIAAIAHTHPPSQVDNILPTGNVGKKRRAFSSACIFFHGVGLFGVGAYYVAQQRKLH